MEIAKDIEAEACLMALMLQTNGRLLDDVSLVNEHFTHPGYAVIFPVLKEIMDKGLKMDFAIITGLLDAKGHLVLAGNGSLITDIVAHGGIWDNRHAYYAKLNECLCRRRMTEIGQLAQSASAPNGPDVQQTLSELSMKIQTIDPSSGGKDVLEETCDDASKLLTDIMAGKKSSGILTGIDAWDDAFGGLEKGKLYALCARMGLGKTAMAEQMTSYVLSFGEPVCFFSCDMDPRELVLRMACRAAEVSLRAVKRGQAGVEKVAEVNANVRLLKRTKFRLHNISHLDGEKLFSVCRAEQRKNGCNIFILDHIQLIYVKPKEDRRTAINNAIQLVSDLCHTHGAAFVALAHLNRNAAKETAEAHHVKESDDLQGACDGMALLYSDQENEDLADGFPREIDMKIGKNRGGPEGKKYLLDFHREQMYFTRRKL